MGLSQSCSCFYISKDLTWSVITLYNWLVQMTPLAGKYKLKLDLWLLPWYIHTYILFVLVTKRGCLLSPRAKCSMWVEAAYCLAFQAQLEPQTVLTTNNVNVSSQPSPRCSVYVASDFPPESCVDVESNDLFVYLFFVCFFLLLAWALCKQHH